VADPIALASPAGVVYAYACGTCHHIASGGEYIVVHSPEEVAQVAESSRALADACCKCDRCGGVCGYAESHCASCAPVVEAEQQARMAAIEAHDARREALQAEALKASKSPEAARQLFALMSDISENCWCASWLSGCEYSLWRFVRAGVATSWGQADVSVEELRSLMDLSLACNGWWTWNAELGGEVFVQFDEWVKRYEAYRKELGGD